MATLQRQITFGIHIGIITHLLLCTEVVMIQRSYILPLLLEMVSKLFGENCSTDHLQIFNDLRTDATKILKSFQ